MMDDDAQPKRRRDQPTTFCSRKPRGTGPITLTISGPMAEKIRDQHDIARGSSVQQWCIEALESFLMDRRSGKVPDRADRHWDRNGDDAEHVVDY